MKKQLFILLFLPMIGVGKISDNPQYKDLNSINIDMWKNLMIDSVELAYEIPFGELHIGPQIDIGIEQEGIHYMFGVHLGIDF